VPKNHPGIGEATSGLRKYTSLDTKPGISNATLPELIINGVGDVY